MNDIYSLCCERESEHFIFRLVEIKDAEQLLKVYSDIEAVRNMNSDNCHGDTFFYQTKQRMLQAIEFWLYSYEQGYFVRMSIVDKKTDEIIGTMEMFKRNSDDYFNDCGLLRLDIRSDYEKKSVLLELFTFVLKTAYKDFNCDKIATKAINQPRIDALISAGFQKSNHKLVGDDKTEYKDYYVKEKES